MSALYRVARLPFRLVALVVNLMIYVVVMTMLAFFFFYQNDNWHGFAEDFMDAARGIWAEKF